MTSNKIQSNYVSEIDQFMQAFDKEHPDKSLSQKHEIAKSERVDRLRDEKDQPDAPKKIWEGF